MSNGMDFPGYIARMLPTRIRGSYLDPTQDYKKHISPLKDPNKSIEDLADYQYGKSQYTFSYSSKSKYKREKRRDGKVRGIVSQAIDRPVVNEMDNSLAEIHTMLTSQGYKSPELHTMVDLIAKQGLSFKEAHAQIGRQYHLDKEQINIYATQLKNLMKAYMRN